MKKTKNRILPFPPTIAPPAQIIICQIGRERFAIHMEIEDLPPPAPVVQLKPRKRKSIR
jgi:hypothetical protein